MCIAEFTVFSTDYKFIIDNINDHISFQENRNSIFIFVYNSSKDEDELIISADGAEIVHFL
jgi:hypothetical protein